MSSTTDTRVYSTSRLRSYYGYEDAPLVDDGFVWKLPKGGRYFGREVLRNERRYELWSPNSLQTPYYPGVRPRASKLLPGNTLDHRRADGQLGRFDPTISPQYFDARRPWLAFLPSPRCPVDEDDAAYTPVHEVWESTPDSGFLGRLDPHFLANLNEANAKADRLVLDRSRVRYSRKLLWDDRPKEPWANSLQALEKVYKFEDAVDLVRVAQRGIVEKEAWARMALAWIKEGGPLEKLKDDAIQPADDELMGVWVHGITELDLYFFLTRAGVPCFLVHELTAEEPAGELVARDFVQWTVIATRLLPRKCGYKRLFLDAGGLFTEKEYNMVTVGVPDRGLEERTRSSSRWQLGLTSDDAVPACRHLFDAARKAEDEDIISLGPTDDEREDRETPAPSVNPAVGATVSLEVAHRQVTPAPTVSPAPKSAPGVAPQVASQAPPVAKPRAPVPPMTFPDLESTVITPILRFPELSEAFSPSNMKAWLDGANRKVAGCGWRRIFRFQRGKRVDYLVEFESAEAALKIRGLIHPKEGVIRESSFMGKSEFQRIVGDSRPVETQEANAAEVGPTAAPYAGGRYIRLEPPTTMPAPPPPGYTQRRTQLLPRPLPARGPVLRRGGGAVRLPAFAIPSETKRTDRYGREIQCEPDAPDHPSLSLDRDSSRFPLVLDHGHGIRLDVAPALPRTNGILRDVAPALPRANVHAVRDAIAIAVRARGIHPTLAPESARPRNARGDGKRPCRRLLLLGLENEGLRNDALGTARNRDEAAIGVSWIPRKRPLPACSRDSGKNRNRRTGKWRNPPFPYWGA
ncbi:hypothetical protein B0H13DRAFT_2335974 [Mycena leptocephala]|nr:hypothetical protein B0H13DRAFT_2335974 [Mycena leptocephala]